MSKLLVINSSSARGDSVSRRLVDAAVARLVEATPGTEVVWRDLDQAPPPHLTSEYVAGVRASAVTEAEHQARALSDRLIAEVLAADTIVIGAPMYNFSIPTVLRSWFDHVLRPGVAFSYSEAGPKGLLGGRRVIVLESRGGLYSEGPGKAADFQEPYLRQLLGFAGITDVSFVHAEKIGYGPEAREAAIAAAEGELDRLVGAGLARAA